MSDPNRPPAASDADISPDPLTRPTVPRLDELLGIPFRVLDNGFVRLVDYMGNDASIVQAARVSYGAGTKQVHNDRGLIRFLLRNGHTTPFEMCEIKLHVRVPMDTWRQWIRHRTASVNEYSTRYSVAIDLAQRTPPDEWRKQAAANRQGSEGTLPASVGVELSAQEEEFQDFARNLYETRIAAGVAREQARKDLPLSTYTEAYWKISLHNLLHFLELRMASHAQAEIRAYATVIGEKIVSRWVPMAWDAFLDYRKHSLLITRVEREIIAALATQKPEEARAIAAARGLLSFDSAGNPVPNRERAELELKLDALGLLPPWF